MKMSEDNKMSIIVTSIIITAVIILSLITRSCVNRSLCFKSCSGDINCIELCKDL